eukprot:12725189-Alexandrium_andersonii.AAC.1
MDMLPDVPSSTHTYICVHADTRNITCAASLRLQAHSHTRARTHTVAHTCNATRQCANLDKRAQTYARFIIASASA